MIGERRLVKLSRLVSTARGHRIVIFFFDVKGLLFNYGDEVIYDQTTDLWFGSSQDAIDGVRGRGPANASWVLRETLVGRVLSASQAMSFGEQSSGSTRIDVEVHEVLLGTAGLRQAQRRALMCDHAEVYAQEEGLEQVWPTGARHRIVWSEPFQVVLHRSPLAQAGAPVMDVHLRLTQRRQGSTSTVALTLTLTPTPELGALPALEELHGRVTGAEAQWLMDTVRYYAKMHGITMPGGQR